MIKVNFFFFLVLLFFHTLVFSQETVSEKFLKFSKTNPMASLFVHFDKNVYANGDDVYFTGYLFDLDSTSLARHEVLSFALVRDADSEVIFSDKFLIVGGLVFGTAVIPDSILTGNYHFATYTNRMLDGKPLVKFIQSIKIISNYLGGIKAFIQPVEEGNAQRKERSFSLNVMNEKNSFLKEPSEIEYKYGAISKKVKTDQLGQVNISIPYSIDPSIEFLDVKVKNRKDSVFLNIPIVNQLNIASVKFYPEGGTLVNGLTSTLGWEVKDQHNKPMAVNATLFEDNKVLLKIETGEHGFGKFNLQPMEGKKYFVKLNHTGIIDSLYEIKNSFNQNLVVKVQEGAIEDSLKVVLSSLNDQKITIRIHDFNQIFISETLNIKSRELNLKISIPYIEKGLAAITIFDSLERPIAERLFFSRYSTTKSIQISTNKDVYKNREPVELELNIADNNVAIVSVSCVLESKLDKKLFTDIESFRYLYNEIDQLAFKVDPLYDKEYLEYILLIKGWRKYSWDTVLKEVNPIGKQNSLAFKGVVLKEGKKLKKTIPVRSLNTLNMVNVETNINGEFELPFVQTIAESSKKMYLFTGAEDNLGYKINLIDPFLAVNKEIAKIPLEKRPLISLIKNNNDGAVVSGNINRIKEVEIKNTNEDDQNYFKNRKRNECGDYVCMYNVLNCKNHLFGEMPTVGKRYFMDGLLKLYTGCESSKFNNPNLHFTKFDGIHLHKEFYVDDYSNELEPALFTTLYWNYSAIVSSSEPTKLKFYTGDVNGKFKIIVQGVASKGPVFNEKIFEVRKGGD